MSERASDFGRIDADGTVFVRTSSGERAVGSWQAGTPEEGLAHYVRRYEDVLTEVNLLATRLDSGAADPTKSLPVIAKLRASLTDAAVVGDLDALAARLDELTISTEKRAAEAQAAKATARAQALASKQALVDEAEKLAADSTQWKSSGDRIKTILDEWKAIKGADRKAETELWKRLAAARDGFTRRRGAYFAGLDATRKEIQTQKEDLITRAEALAESDDWGPTASQLKQLMTEWKSAGRAARDVEAKLWDRFRAAQDKFFARRSEVFDARDAVLRENLVQKEAIAAEAEAIDLADPKAAQRALRDIQNRWEAAGAVPREATSAIDRRLRAVENKVRGAADEAFRKVTPESNPLLAQMRQQVAEAQAKLDKARAAGDARRIKDAEAALESKQRFLNLAEKSS